MDPERLWARQERRADLADRFWHLLGGRPGWRVADVGCGPGYFALRYAMLTGPTGHVHAVDDDPAALAYLGGRMDPAQHAHVTTERLDITRAPLPDLHFDAVVCANMLHHVDDVAAALRHMRVGRARLLIAEFDPEGPGEIGPPMEMRVAPQELTRAMAEAGWEAGSWLALPHEMYAILGR